MKNVLIFLLFAVIAVAAITYQQPAISVASVITAAYFYFRAFREMRKGVEAGHQEVLATDAQLRTELTAAHRMVLAKLSTAEEELKNKVIELLVEAGKHLGNPVTNSRLVYGPDFYLKWNREGLALVAQARQLTEAYAADNAAH